MAEPKLDEVSALVLDPGYSTTRAGFAGEDTPKSVCPTHYGVLEGRSLFGENEVHNPIAKLDIRNPYSSEGVVENWDAATKLWEYSITSRLTGPRGTHPSRNGLNDGMNGDGGDVDMEDMEEMEKPMSDAPLLMTEPAWNSQKGREKCIEVAMEDWQVPAFWLGKTGVMSAYSQGKSSALVIDIGASTTSVTPVSDGLILKKGVMKSPLAGNFVSNQIRLAFAQSSPPVPMVPHYVVSTKRPVEAGAPSDATYNKYTDPPTDSFRRFQEERVLTEFKESVVQVWDGNGPFTRNEETVKGYPGRPFEMPDGWNNLFGAERYKVTEGLFDPKAAFTDSENPAPKPEQTIPAMIAASLAAVDVDIRPNLLANVVVVGGSSLLTGLNKRINQELEAMYPGPRVRLTASANTVERKYAGWIGGSILASLGSFHQMWISKKEYDEHGANIVDKRCK